MLTSGAPRHRSNVLPNRMIACVALLILDGCAGPGPVRGPRVQHNGGSAGLWPAQEVDVVSHALSGKLDRMLAARRCGTDDKRRHARRHGRSAGARAPRRAPVDPTLRHASWGVAPARHMLDRAPHYHLRDAFPSFARYVCAAEDVRGIAQSSATGDGPEAAGRDGARVSAAGRVRAGGGCAGVGEVSNGGEVPTPRAARTSTIQIPVTIGPDDRSETRPPAPARQTASVYPCPKRPARLDTSPHAPTPIRAARRSVHRRPKCPHPTSPPPPDPRRKPARARRPAAPPSARPPFRHDGASNAPAAVQCRRAPRPEPGQSSVSPRGPRAPPRCHRAHAPGFTPTPSASYSPRMDDLPPRRLQRSRIHRLGNLRRGEAHARGQLRPRPRARRDHRTEALPLRPHLFLAEGRGRQARRRGVEDRRPPPRHGCRRTASR